MLEGSQKINFRSPTLSSINDNVKEIQDLYQVCLIAYKSRRTPPRFCLAPKPPLPASGEGIKGLGSDIRRIITNQPNLILLRKCPKQQIHVGAVHEFPPQNVYFA